jgi:uncharacterized membrane protein YeiH
MSDDAIGLTIKTVAGYALEIADDVIHRACKAVIVGEDGVVIRQIIHHPAEDR